MTAVQEQFNVFMKTPNSRKPHVGILVEGFEQNGDSISFTHEGNTITIPITKVLSPSKKKILKKEYVDFNKKMIWVFLKGTIIIDTTSDASVDCHLTCKKPLSLPIITALEMIQLVIPTYYDFPDDIKF